MQFVARELQTLHFWNRATDHCRAALCQQIRLLVLIEVPDGSRMVEGPVREQL
jgi:hypothetical protein